jgi:uncharacterized repeat protein (TIGR02543 family)
MKKLKIFLLGVMAAIMVFSVAAISGCEEDTTPRYNVVFDTRGGSQIDGYTLEEGATISKPATTPEKELFVFDTWYSDSTCKNVYIFGGKMPAHDVTIYAGWLAEESIKITFDANGGTFANSQTQTSLIGNVGEKITSPANPEKTGYVFGGWYTEPECKNAYSLTVYPDEQITLYAKWADDSNYAYVKYYGNGKLLTTTPVLKGGKVEEVKIFDEDITSSGWFTDEALTKPYTFGNGISENVNLYASYYTTGLIIKDGTVTGYSGTSDTVIIPSVYEGKKVTTIGEFAFYKSSELTAITSVTLPDSVTTVEKGAFYDCRYLVSVNLSSNVTKLGTYIFYNNTRLKTYGDLSSITAIPEGMFIGCEGLSSVTLHDGITSIGEKAFSNCKNLVELTIPEGVSKLQDYTFSNCTSLTTVEIKSTAFSTMGKGVFENCNSLVSVKIQSSARVTFSAVGKNYVFSPFVGCDQVIIYVEESNLQSYINLYGYLDNGTLADKFAAID